MPYANWDPAMSVGVDELDADHQRLLDILNRLHDALGDIKAAQIGQALLLELKRYGQEHFAREEGVMERAGFPDLARHARNHKDYIERIATYLSAVGQGHTPVAEMHDYLKHWLMEHIMGLDQEYARFLRQDQGRRGEGNFLQDRKPPRR